MLLSFRDPFACPPETYWRSLFDPELVRLLAAQSGTEVELLHERHDGPLRTRHERYALSTPMPALLRRATGMTRIEYEQRSVFDDHRLHATWQILPPAGRDRVHAAGTFEVLPHPDGCERVMQGEVRVQAPLIGPQLEQLIVSALTQAFHKGTATRRAWLRERR